MFEDYFIYGSLPLYTEKGDYIPLLVFASYVVASFGSYIGLTLAVRIGNVQSQKEKNILHWAGAFALGSGIWSMHFVGMLAYKMNMVLSYDPWLTAMSMLIAVATAYGVLQIARAAKFSPWRVVVASILLGASICAMHYTGMAAMVMQADLLYIPSYFILSAVIAVGASGAALWIVFYLPQHSGRWQRAWRGVAALVMGAAICGMHYTGMKAAVFIPFANCRYDPTQSFDMLAFAVVIVTSIIFSGALALSVQARKKKFLAQLLSNLPITLLIAAVFSLPLIVIVYQAVSVLDSQVGFAEKEQYGVQYHNALMRLLQRTEEMRSLTFMARNGNKAAAAELKPKEAQLRDEISIVDEADRSLGKLLSTTETWQGIKQGIVLQMNRQNLYSADRQFQDYSTAARSILAFMSDVNDNSNLAIDPQLDTNFLLDAMINITPPLTETLEKMQGLAGGILLAKGAPSHWTQGDIRQLQALHNELNLQLDNLENSLVHAQKANAKSASFVRYFHKALNPRLKTFDAHIENIIFKHADDGFFTGDPRGLSEINDPCFILYTRTAWSISDLLDERIRAYKVKKNMVLYSSTAAGAGFVMLFIFLYRNLVRTRQDEEKLRNYSGMLKKQYEELQRAKALAESASVAKSDFLANMSHELRTPLNSILGMNRLLLESSLETKQRELADTVFRSSVNLLEIVNDILDLSKIEAGEMELERIGFDPHYVLESVIDALDHIAGEKRVPLIKHYEGLPFPYLLGDPTRLSRVLTNLVGNAIKYTDKGHVEVRATIKKLDDEHVELRCEVIDTGIGIPKEKQESIFEKFVQADTSTTRKYGGTGLGLAITKQLIELMDGTIGIQSEVGKGSTFSFAIPFEVTDKLNEEKRVRRQKMLCGIIPPARAQVLVAEDHPMNQLFITKLMEKFGISHFEIAGNGNEVLKHYHEKPWDIILMDCHMPGKNGYDTTKEIRDFEKGTDVHVPIVAMTANAMVGDKEKCLRYGMDEYISKPLDVDELKEVLSQWLHFPEESAAPSNGASAVNPVQEGRSHVDLTQLVSIVGKDKNIQKELVRLFATQSDNNLRILGDSRKEGENKAWVEAAHMFKGGAGNIGAEVLHRLCEEAQRLKDAKAEERNVLFTKISSEYMLVKKQLADMGLLS